MNIPKIGTAKSVQKIIDELKEATNTEELVVLRTYRDKETGRKHFEWWCSEVESRIWTTGALNHLAYRISISNPDDELS